MIRERSLLQCTCELMNGNILMHVKKSLVQVKDQYNFCTFNVKFGETISTNENHAEKKQHYQQTEVCVNRA